MKEKINLATISILIKNREKNSDYVHEVLRDNSKLVLTRMGMNIQPKCISNCLGVVTVIVQGSAKEINDLTKKLNKKSGISAKLVILEKE